MRRRSTGVLSFEDEVFVLSASAVDERGGLLVAITMEQLIKVSSVSKPYAEHIGVRGLANLLEDYLSASHGRLLDHHHSAY
jgi:hypothetical protein